MSREVGIENRVAQRGDGTLDALVSIERAAMFRAPINWPSRSLSCRTRHRLNATLFLEPPEESAVRSIRARPRYPQRPRGTTRSLFQHRALAEPGAPSVRPSKVGLAAARHGAHAGQDRDDTGPVFEGIAAQKVYSLADKGFLTSPARATSISRSFSSARLSGDALEVILSNHDRIDRRGPPPV